MLLLKIDKESKIPLFTQIYDEIRRRIENGILKPGDKLPASRQLARNLGLNRTTVYRAYEELWSFGYIESRQGAYSIVRERIKPAISGENIKGEHFNWGKIANPNTKKLLTKKSRFVNSLTDKGVVNFIPLSPDPQLMPYELYRKYLNKALIEGGASLLTYNNALGYRPLIEFIHSNIGQHGIYTSIDNIMITNGTQNALELIIKYIVKPGNKIIVESPTYSIAIPLFEYYGADIFEVPLSQDGLDLDSFEATIKRNKVALVFTMANFQNPTGITTTQVHREKLYGLCKEHNIPVIEDGFEEEMKYFGKVTLPIKSMDDSGLVIYLGTFSKTLFPGLRIGWIVADNKLINALVRLKQISDISGNFLVQASVYEFCQSGNYELHVKRLHRVYRKRMSVALKSAEKYLPKSFCTFSKPAGGYSFWIQLKHDSLSENELIKILLEEKVALAPGNLFFVESKKQPAFRLSIAQVSEIEIEEGLRRIGNTFSKLENREPKDIKYYH